MHKIKSFVVTLISHGKQLSVAMQVLWYLVLLATMRLSYGI
jgi:hypothetical protein